MKKALLLIILFVPLWLAAQEMPFSVKTKTRYTASGTMGYEDVNGYRYYQLRLIQEFRYWKLGMGVDLDFLLDSNYHLKTADWDQFSDVLDKIYYIKYGQKGEPFYFHMGGFPGVTMGNGLIMQNYSNMLLYPDLRNIGLMLGVNPRWPTNPSIELFTSNLRRNQIMSFAARCKPLPDSAVTILDGLTLGISAAIDRNQYGNLKYIVDDEYADEVEDLIPDPASIYGVAYNLPLYSNGKITVGQYTEFAHINGYGSGAVLPGFYLTSDVLQLNLEYRVYGSKFTPSFFDQYYEEERAVQPDELESGFMTKEQALGSFKPALGFNGSIQAFLFHKVKTRFAWQNMYGKGLKTGRSFWFRIWVDTQWKRLENVSVSYNKLSTERLEVHSFNQPNAEFQLAATFRVYKDKWFLIGKYSERYKDKDGDGWVSWAKETRRTAALGLRYIQK